MNLGDEKSALKKSVVNKVTLQRDKSSGLNVLMTTRRKDKEHLWEITAQLQNFVEKKNNLKAKNKLLQKELELVERYHQKRVGRVTMIYQEKMKTLKSENEKIKQETKIQQVRVNNALRDKDEAEFKYKKTCEEKECYETQLTEIL